MKWINAIKQARIKVNRDFQRKRFSQIRLARNITRISPRSVYSYIGETLAGTGFERHIRFLEDAERYRQQLAEFVREKDQTDEDSAHLYFVEWGLSHEEVDPESIPCFVESSLSLEECLQSVLPDIALLFLFGVVFFMGAFVSFLRYDVR